MLKLKIVIGGESGVGKSTLVHRFTYGTFPLTELHGTIGVDFIIKEITIPNFKERIKLSIFDFGGETRFRALFPRYAQGANGIILAFDSSRIETLLKLHEWLEILDLSSETPILLISTKNDLGYKVPEERLKEFFDKYHIVGYIPTSSLLSQNVEKAFVEITKAALQVLNVHTL